MQDYIINRRRFYHEHPELSGNEVNTRRNIKLDLKAIGIDKIREMQNCCGLTAEIDGSGPGRTVALRADIDALNICERTGLPFASKNGSMHACGHDCHIAMLLGAAKILNNIKDKINGHVRLIFQPAEENAMGANAMIAENVLDGVDAIYGAHVWGTFDAPLFDVSSGGRMACADRFVIEVNGTASHASEPHLGVDAIAVSAAIINNLQQCASRMNNPLNPFVLTIGMIEGGKAWNILSDRVVMQGTVRSFCKDFRFREIMQRIIDGTANAFGATSKLKYERFAPALFNNSEELNDMARDTVINLYGKRSLGQMPMLMASEDFGRYGDAAGIPSVFVFIGSRNEKKGITFTNHSEKYTVDEDILLRGASVMAKFAENFLNA